MGSDAIGEKRKPSEVIGKECADYLCDIVDKKATADKYFADQIIPYMALAEGISVIKSELTDHTKTNIWLCKQFLGKEFVIKPNGPLKEIRTED